MPNSDKPKDTSLQSTPLRKGTSHRVSSDTHTLSKAPPQSVLKGIIEDEIGDQTWKFNAETISRMLSPKKLKQLVKRDSDLTLLLNSYDCDVSSNKFKTALLKCKVPPLPSDWPSVKDERSYYIPLANFLNDCVKEAKVVLPPEVGNEPRYFHSLHFVKYDKQVGDGVGSADKLKPDICGGNKLKEFPHGGTLFWNPPKAHHLQVQIPVEVKENNKEMVKQAATYARCLFSVHPSRTFALVLSFNHVFGELRFLIFHRGGLTSSHPLKIKDEEGRRDIMRLIMTMLLWKDKDAGFIGMSNNTESIIPTDNGHLIGTVKEVLHDSLCIRGRGSYVCRMSVVDPRNVKSTGKTSTARTGNVSSQPPDLKPNTQTVVAPRRSARLKREHEAAGADPRKKLRSDGNPQSNDSKGKGGGSNSKGGGQASATTHTERNDMKNKDLSEQMPILPQTERPHPVVYEKPIALIFGNVKLRSGQDIILKRSWQLDSRKKVESKMYNEAGELFGIPKFVCSYQAAHPGGEPISNCLFLPTEEQCKEAYWPIFGDICPKHPEVRFLCYVAICIIGTSLVEAKSSWQLCEAIIHSMLGWLSLYQIGYLHRDVSIGNILLTTDTQNMKMKEFAFNRRFLDSLKASATNNPSAVTSAVNDVSKIEALMKDLNISSTYIGFITDGDMSADLRDYFSYEHTKETRSGTVEFMSFQLQEAMEEEQPYLHSPIDDLHSFFWVGLWAVLFNTLNQSKRSPVERKTQAHLEEATHQSKSSAVNKIHNFRYHGHSDIASQWYRLLENWYESIVALQKDWEDAVLTPIDKKPPEDRSKYFLPRFHQYALRGVAEFLKLAADHKEALKAHKNFE